MESIEKLREICKYRHQVVNTTISSDGRAVANLGEHCINLIEKAIDEIEREIIEKYMLLPCDVNGEPIHVSDQVEVFGTGKWIGVYLIGNEWIEDMNGIKHSVYSIRHTKPDPYKELLKEFAYKVCDLSVSDDDIARYADRIRELMEVDA